MDILTTCIDILICPIAILTNATDFVTTSINIRATHVKVLNNPITIPAKLNNNNNHNILTTQQLFE